MWNRSGVLTALAVASSVLAAPAFAGCKWVDGSDASVPDDGGRGVADWKAHFGAGTTSPTRVAGWIGSRIATLQGCLAKDDQARLYADVSVLIAHYGRKGAGWIDGGDPSLPTDGGRGVSDWRAHQAWALTAGTAPMMRPFIEGRLSALLGKLPKDGFAHLYADLSILIAIYGR